MGTARVGGVSRDRFDPMLCLFCSSQDAALDDLMEAVAEWPSGPVSMDG